MHAESLNPEIPAGDIRRPIGVMAGWGRLPFAVAQALRKQGRRVVGVGIRDHADPRLAELCEQFDWIGVGGIGRGIRLLRGWGVTEAAMAGKVHKTMFLRRGWWLRHFPDWTCIKAFYPQLLTGSKDRKDDTLLGTLVAAYARGGITFLSATDFAPELLVKAGQIVGRPLTAKQKKDVEFGWQIAKEMGQIDVGQSVCVKDQAVIAVEAIEGTDACIQRAGQLCEANGFTVVKVAKPQQDMRWDVPTVGVQTLETIAKAGGRVLAIEAGRTFLLDDQDFRQAAQQLKVSVVALDESSVAEAAA